ncbi:MAG TPA: GIY-YIG nuclease family protein [Planctomycetota bacterium]
MGETESRGCWVYIAELGDGRLYVGVTNNPDRRVIEHQLGTSIRTTRIFGFRKLLYLEPHSDLTSARGREQQLKGWSRAKKLALIAGDVSRLKELSRSRQQT